MLHDHPPFFNEGKNTINIKGFWSVIYQLSWKFRWKYFSARNLSFESSGWVIGVIAWKKYWYKYLTEKAFLSSKPVNCSPKSWPILRSQFFVIIFNGSPWSWVVEITPLQICLINLQVGSLESYSCQKSYCKHLSHLVCFSSNLSIVNPWKGLLIIVILLGKAILVSR